MCKGNRVEQTDIAGTSRITVEKGIITNAS
nr:MAG TPA: hypothetical protein [Caudoviricetes sp.]